MKNDLQLSLESLAYLLNAPRRAKLRRNIRGWIAPAIAKGRGSVEWKFVADWSLELRCLESR